jgi:hypothetical protein
MHGCRSCGGTWNAPARERQLTGQIARGEIVRCADVGDLVCGDAVEGGVADRYAGRGAAVAAVPVTNLPDACVSVTSRFLCTPQALKQAMIQYCIYAVVMGR